MARGGKVYGLAFVFFINVLQKVGTGNVATLQAKQNSATYPACDVMVRAEGSRIPPVDRVGSWFSRIVDNTQQRFEADCRTIEPYICLQ